MVGSRNQRGFGKGKEMFSEGQPKRKEREKSFRSFPSSHHFTSFSLSFLPLSLSLAVFYFFSSSFPFAREKVPTAKSERGKRGKRKKNSVWERRMNEKARERSMKERSLGGSAFLFTRQYFFHYIFLYYVGHLFFRQGNRKKRPNDKEENNRKIEEKNEKQQR